MNNDLAANTSLVLTATINPKGMPDSPFSVSDRMSQYIDALVYYAKQYPHLHSIVFAENSGHDLAPIRQVVKAYTNVCFLSFGENDFPRERGKGYGELKLLCDCFDCATYPDTPLFIKITGRLKVLNLDRIFSHYNNDVNFICDSKTLNVRFWNKSIQPIHTDARLFLMRRHFFDRYLRSSASRVNENEGFYLENLLHELAQMTIDNGAGVIDRFAVEPDIEGYGAHFGGKNYRSPKQRLKYIVRNIARHITPGLKF